MALRTELVLLFLYRAIFVVDCSSAETSTAGGPFRSVSTPKKIQNYEIYSSSEIEERLQRWALHYTDLTRLTTAQDQYDLPRAGGPDDCPFAEGDGCPNSILTIQDFVAHPAGSASSNRLPEVLWSGELHGNEQVGPTSVMQAAELLLEATACLALPRLSVRKENPSEWNEEVEEARKCREALEDYGISVEDMWWLGRLVSTRRIVIVPTANSLGYFRKIREEDRFDPNRDFPFDYLKSSAHPDYNTNCMKTIAARTLNEVFREHMFQLSLTFHGGMEVIGYEWGAPSYERLNTSPDDAVQGQVAAAYSRFGGGWSGSSPYRYGPMNTFVYPVRGGMEDWAYAGSWDPDRVIPCRPPTFTDYPLEKTKYNNSTLRVLNMLVETSNEKIPKSNLGSSVDLLNGFSVAGNGHISRNIRLALLSAELVQPWLSIRRVNELPLTDDIIPLGDRTGRASCQEFKLVSVPGHSRRVVIEWTVGGSLRIDNSKLWYAKWSDVPDLNCIDQPPRNIEELMKEGTPISYTSGKTRFATTSSARMAHFSASIDVSDFDAHDKIVVLASSRVDQDWGSQPDPYEPGGVPPQSHMANVRTNPNWYHKSGDKVIQGRLDWFSSPLTIEMGEYDNSVETVEMSIRIPSPSEGSKISGPSPVPGPSHADNRGNSGDGAWSMVLVGVCGLSALFLSALVLRCSLRERIRFGQRRRLRNFIADEDAPSPGLHQDPDAEDDSYRDEPEQHGVEMERYP